MRAWDQDMADLAAATAALLADGPVRTEPMRDLPATLAARDAVLVGLRELVRALVQAPRAGLVRELTVFDVVQRPGQALYCRSTALYQALAELPRAVAFGTAQLSGAIDLTLADYEQHWYRAAHAMIGLEGSLPGLSELPGHQAWGVLRELGDVAAAMSYLDHDLAEAILPALKTGEDLTVAYRQLIAGHDAVRITAGEIRTRIPAPERPVRPAAAVAGRLTGGGLAKAMNGYARAVAARADQLSVSDLRAVARLLEFGAHDAVHVLERSSAAVGGAADVVFGLTALPRLAGALRDSAVRSPSMAHLDVVRGVGEIGKRMEALRELAGRLPDGASDQDLRRLAAPALEFAAGASVLTQQVHVAVRESLRTGSMLVPGRPSERNPLSAQWVSPYMNPAREGPPAVQQRAEELARAASRLGPAVRVALDDVGGHHDGEVDPSKRALAAARSHAGAASGQLRALLGQRITDQPTPLSATLPTHPQRAPVRDNPAGRR